MAEPFRIPNYRRLEYFNEATLLVWCYCMFIFTDFVADPVIRFQVGYILDILVGLNLLVNLLVLYWTNARKLYYKTLNKFKKWAGYKSRKEQQEERLKKRRAETQPLEVIQTPPVNDKPLSVISE